MQIYNFYLKVQLFVLELELVKLPEDMTLAGFTPLMSNPQDPCYAEKNEDMVSTPLYIYKKNEILSLFNFSFDKKFRITRYKIRLSSI